MTLRHCSKKQRVVDFCTFKLGALALSDTNFRLHIPIRNTPSPSPCSYIKTIATLARLHFNTADNPSHHKAMPTNFHIETFLPIPADLLWRVRVSKPFMSHLVSNGALNRMDATPARLVSGQRSIYTRVQTYVPATMEIPDIVKAVFDDSYIEITDTQTWDEGRPLRQSFSIRPGVMSDYVRTEGEIRMQEVGDVAGEGGGCLQVLSGECRVSMPFLGWYVEQAIVANMRTFYEGYPGHVAAFVDMVVNRWGDGRIESLRQAVDNMLAEAKEME